MRRNARRRKRLIAIAVVLFLIPAGFGLILWLQSAAQEQNLREARVAGLQAYERGDYDEALPHLSYVVRRDQSDVEVLLAFADARERLPLENNRHLFESIGLLLAVLHEQPQHVQALERLLSLYERTGRRLEWIGVAERLLAIRSDHTEALRLLAVGHSLVSEFDTALKYTQRLIEHEPNELRWRLFHLQLMRDRGDSRRAILALCDQWIVETHTEGGHVDGRFHMLKASYLASIGELDEARAAAVEAAGQGANSGDVLQRLVSLLDGMRLRDEATDLILRTRQRFPDRQWPHEADVRRLWQSGRIDEALARIELVRSSHNDLSSGMLRWKSLLHIQMQDPFQAERALTELERRVEADAGAAGINRAWIEAIRARIDLDAANWNEALEKYRSAIAQEPNDAVLHFLVGEAYQHAGERDLATASFERAVRADPNWIAAQILYTESLLQTGRSEAAARVAVNLIRRTDEPAVDLYLLFARAWMASGMTADELGVRGPDGSDLDPAHLLRILRENVGDHAEITELLVHALLDEGDEASAGEVIEQSIASEEADPDSMIRLARTSHSANLGFERRLIERAIEHVGLTVEIAEIKARILHQEGNTLEGRELLATAIAEHPPGSLEYSLGERALATFLVVTEQTDATDVLRRILESAAGNPEQIAFVLAQPIVWTEPDLAYKGVRALKDSLGESSLRVSLARATYILHFERDQPAAMADALVLANDVLQRTPDSLGARTLMAALHLASKPPDPEAAIRQLQRAIRAHPRRADLYPQLIALLQQQGDFATAEAHLNRLSSLTGRNENLRRTEIQLLERQGDFQSIIALLGDRLAAASSEADRVMLLTSYHRAGNSERAEQVARTLLAAPDPSPAALGSIAQFYADTGRYEEGLELLREFESRDAAGAALLLGAFHQYTGRTSEAERWLLRAVDRSPDDPRAWNLLAEHYLRIGEAREAREAARSGLNIAPKDQDLQAKLVLSTLSLGMDASHDRHEIDALLDSIGQENSAMAATLRAYARIASREGGVPHQRDIADLNRIVRDHGNFLPAWRLAIAANAQLGDLEGAAGLARRAMARFPNEAEPAELATRILIDLGRPSEALEMARSWRNRSLERTLVPDAVIASLFVDLGRARRAIEHLQPHEERIVTERDDSPQHLRTWLSALAAGGEIERALKLIRPLHEQGETRWAEALLGLTGRLASGEAARVLEQLEPLLAEDSDGRIALAGEWATLGMRSEQTSYLERAAALAQQAAEEDASAEQHAQLIIASIAEHRDDLQGAKEHYRVVLASDPNNVMALNNLAHVLVRMGRAPDEAVSLSERALALVPDHPDLLDTHAQALLAAGRPDEARHHAHRALEQRPNDAVALLTLTKVFLAQNQVDEAHSTFQRASSVIETLPVVTKHIRSKHSEIEQAILSAHLTPDTRGEL